MNQILEFLKNNYFFILYGITLIIALVRYHRYFDSVLQYFPVFIGYTILTEALGYLIAHFDAFQLNYTDEYPTSNNLIFNVYDLVFFMYFYFIFWQIIPLSRHKNIIKCGALVYIVASLLNPFIQNFIIYPQLYALIVGSLVLVLCIFQYLKSRSIYLKDDKMFVWISIGLLTFVPFFPIILYLGLFNEEVYYKLHLRRVQHVLIVAMYTCFSIGFLLMKKKLPKTD